MVTRQASSLKRKNSISIGLFSDLKKQRQVGNSYYLLLLIKIFWNLAFSSKQIQFATTDLSINGTFLARFYQHHFYYLEMLLPQVLYFKEEDQTRSLHIQTAERHTERIKVRFPIFFYPKFSIHFR